jgi:small-conductance mechanosensitive channel
MARARSGGRRRLGGTRDGTRASRARLRRRVGRRYRGGTQQARSNLRFFRQATILAVAVTAFLLLLFAPAEDAAGTGFGAQVPAQPAPPAQVPEIPDTVAIIQPVAVEDLQQPPATVEEEIRADTLVRAAREELARTLRGLWYGFLSNLPAFLVATLILLLAAGAVRVVRPLMRKGLRQWERSSAASAMVGIAIWLFAIGVAVSVIAGDVRALLGSLGLVGLALSWALQTPIESFTGWLLNSFQGYYRVGDRIGVGEVFGDVYRIDFLTTTVWEIGSLDRPGFVQAEQPTGRLITFPNSEVLAGSIVNLTRDFPYVWDELSVPVANRSDLAYAAEVIRTVAAERLEPSMEEPAGEYEAILRAAGISYAVSRRAQVFVSLADSWTDLTVRYLVSARERRRWKSELAAAVMTELNRAEHADKIISVFPRQQIQFIGPDGKPREVGWSENATASSRDHGQ